MAQRKHLPRKTNLNLPPITPHINLQPVKETTVIPEGLTPYNLGYKSEIPSEFVSILKHLNTLNLFGYEKLFFTPQKNLLQIHTLVQQPTDISTSPMLEPILTLVSSATTVRVMSNPTKRSHSLLNIENTPNPLWSNWLQQNMVKALEAFKEYKHKPSKENLGVWLMLNLVAKNKTPTHIAWLADIPTSYASKFGLAKTLRNELDDADKSYLYDEEQPDFFIQQLIDLHQ